MVKSNPTYEEIRRQNIEKNNRKLEELKLRKLGQALHRTSPKRAQVSVRRSPRIANISNGQSINNSSSHIPTKTRATHSDNHSLDTSATCSTQSVPISVANETSLSSSQGFQVNATSSETRTTSTSGSLGRISKNKDGLPNLPEGVMIVMKTDGLGRPDGPQSAVAWYSSALGVLARRDIPCCYESFTDVPPEHKTSVFRTLEKCFKFEDNEHLENEWSLIKLNAAWKDYKSRLYKRHVKDKPPMVVKESPPDGIPLEDWRAFVDLCNTEKFQVASKRNTVNRVCQTDPACLGRKSTQVARREMAMEMNVPCSAITRTNMFLRIHTRADNTPQRADWVEKIRSSIASDPSSHMTSVDDAVTKATGKKDGRGIMRGLGAGICKTAVKKMDPLLRKNQTLVEENLKLWTEVTDIKNHLASQSSQINEIKTMLSQERPHVGSDIGLSFRSSHSSRVSSVNNESIGKEVNLFGGFPPQLVATGVIDDVNPERTYGDRRLGEGNTLVYVESVLVKDDVLPCPHDEWSKSKL